MVKVKKEKDRGKGFAKSFLEGIPLLGGLVKELSKTDLFKKKLEEVDETHFYIICNSYSFNKISTWKTLKSLIIEEAKKEGGKMFIGEDYLTGMRDDKLILAAKAPQEEVQIELKGKTVKLQAKDWKKIIDLPDKFSKVTNIRYKNGVLMLELAK